MKILSNPSVLVDSVLKPGFLSYPEYAEIKLLEPGGDSSFCYRCGESLVPLTYLEPEFYYQPCWDCVDAKKRKSERQSVVDGVLRNIKEFYYSRILGDRYLQLFIIDPIYFRNTLPHEYSMFKKVIGHLSPPSRNDIWFLDWVPGYPKVISLENLNGLQLVNLSEFYDIDNQAEKIVIGDYEVIFPELVNYDSKHHSRYSLFNKAKSIKTKRLKIGDKCIKFYNTERDNIKSIFKLLKNGEEINIGSLRKQDFAIIKLALMRNKNCLRLIFEVILEIIKACGKFRDTVFLKNTILIDPKKDKELNLLWTIKSYEELVSDETINISII